MPDKKETQEDLKKKVLLRLKKIEGQVKGIAGMVESEKECEDILIQVKAVGSALRSLNTLILTRFMMTCYMDDNGEEKEDETYERLQKAIRVISGYIGT